MTTQEPVFAVGHVDGRKVRVCVRLMHAYDRDAMEYRLYAEDIDGGRSMGCYVGTDDGWAAWAKLMDMAKCVGWGRSA